MRGYDLGEIGKTHSSIGGTAEIMIPLDAQIGLALFGDIGGGTVLQADSGEMAVKGGSAMGVGVKYGPFRIDYAFNHARRRRVHVGLVAD